MLFPGASRSSSGPVFDVPRITSLLVVAPTETMLDRQDGALMPVFDDPFPEAAMVGIPSSASTSAAAPTAW
jgi:hypothetical protein